MVSVMLGQSLHRYLFLGIISWLNFGSQAAETTTCPGPSNLIVLKKAFNSADLRWDVTKYIPNPTHCVCNDQGDVTEYCTQSVVPKTCIKSLTGYLRTVPSLSVYTNYTFCVQTQCADSNFSLPLCTKYTTAPTAPSQPYQIFADKHSPSSLDISWRYPVILNGPLDGYKIRWCYAPQCVFTEEHLEGGTRRSYRITGLEAYKEYLVYVSAYNVDGGKYLYGAEASVKDFTLPTYPSNPSMTFTKVSTSQVNVLIGVPKYPNGPISGYVLRWCPKRRCYGPNVGEREILQPNAGTQAVTGLQFWTEYAFSVSAFNILLTDNSRIYSDVVNDSVITMPFSPAGPQQFKVVALSSTSVKLTWEAPVNPDVTPSHYRLFWCTKDNRFCFNADVGNVREAVIQPLAPWTTYTFMVKALVQFTGPWLNSQVSSITGRTWAAEPSRPTNLRVSKQQATTVDVSWQMPLDPVGPLDGFRIRICPELGTCPPMGLISRYKTLNSKTLTHSFYGLEAYTNYQVQVRAFNSLPNGETAEGDVAVVAVTTTPSSPSEPTQLQVKAINSSALSVTWRPPSHPNGPVKGYQVTWWKTGGASTDDVEDRLGNKTVFVPGDAYSYTVTQLQAYKTYAVQVTRINGDHNSTWNGAAAHAEGMTDPAPCPPPTQLSATAVKVNATSSKADVSWTAPNGTFDPPIQGYFVHLCKVEVVRGTPAEGKCQYSNTSASVFALTFEGLENLADYRVAVSAFVVHDGRYIEGDEAAEFVATEAPPIPTVVGLNYTTSNWSIVNVSWSSVTGLETYNVVYFVALYLTEDDTPIVTQNTNGTETSFEGLRAWTSYTVRVSACLPRSTKLECGDAGVLKFETPPTESSAPTAVEVNVVNSTALEVTWGEPAEPNGPLSGYQLTWWMTSGTATLHLQERLNNKTILLPRDSRSTLLVGLEPYRTYVIEVVAINVVAKTSWTGVPARVEGTTDPSPSSEPTELLIERINVNFSSCDIELSWSPPNGTYDPPVRGYYVRLCQVPMYGQNETKCFAWNATSIELRIVFEGATTFAEYVAEVRAYVLHGRRIIEGNAAVSTLTVRPETIPTVNNVRATAFNHSFVKVSWDEVSGMSDVRFAYDVRVYLASNETVIRQEYVDDTVWVLTGLSQRTNYTVTVAVCILQAHSEQCGAATASDVRTLSVVQTQLTDIRASALNSTAIQVTWNFRKDSSESVEDYRITWWKTEGPSTDKTDVLVRGDSETFTISELDSYESYTIQIAKTTGEVIEVVTGVKTYPTPSSQPTGLVVETTDVSTTSSKVVVSWNAPSVVSGPEIEGYIVVICPAESNDTVYVESSCQTRNVSASHTTAEFEDLEKFVDYVIEVQAYVRHEGRLIEGEVATATVSTGPSSVPTVSHLKLTVSNSSSVHVSWREPVGLEHYSVVYDVRVYLSGSGEEVLRLDVNRTETTLTQLTYLTNYTVRVFVCLVMLAKRQCGEPGSSDFQTLPDPREPSNVRVSVINSTSLAVTWDRPDASSEPEEGYQITWWRDGPPSSDSTPESNGTTLASSDSGVFIITNLEPYQNYVVQVARGSRDQNSAWELRGVRGSGSTDPAPSPQPTGLVVETADVTTSSSKVVVSWNAPSIVSGPEVEGYIVIICPAESNETVSDESSCQTRNVSASDTTAEFEGLEKFVDYVVEVKAYVKHGDRLIEGEVATATVSTGPSSVPTVSHLELTVSNSSSVHVSWREPVGLEHLRVVYDVRVYLSGSDEEVLRLDVNRTETTLTQLTYLTNYTVRIFVCLVRLAKRQCGEPGSSDFKTLADPREPTNVRVYVINSTSLTVTWDRSSESSESEEGYQITWWRSGASSAPETNGTTLVPPDSTVYIITNLEPYQNYVVQVARGSRDQSSAWEMRGVRVIGSTDPAPSPPPTGLTASSSSSQVTVTWNPVVHTSGPPVQGYVVIICPVQDDSESRLASGCHARNTSATELTVLFEDLEKFTDYVVEVWAYVEHKEQVVRGEVSTVRVSTDPPEIPFVDSLMISVSNQSIAHVTWRRPAGLDEYRVVYQVRVVLKTSGDEVFEFTVEETEVTLSNLTYWTDYAVRVSACVVRAARRICGGPDGVDLQALGDPREPGNIRVSVINSTSLSVSWDKPILSDEPVESYQVTWWKADGSSNGTAQASKTALVSEDADTFIITDLEPYQKYIVQVARANNFTNDRGAVVAGRSEGTTDPSPSSPPNDLTLRSTGTVYSSSNVTVTWTPPDGSHGPPIQGYVVIVCRADEDAENREAPSCKSTNTTSRTLTLLGLRTFSDYIVEVRAYAVHNGRIIEGAARTAVLSTDPSFVPAVTNVTLDTSNDSSVLAAWQEPPGLEGFRVVYNVTVYETDGGTVVLHQDVNETEAHLTGLREGANYTVTVSTCLVRPTRRQCGESSSAVFRTPQAGSSNKPTELKVKAVNSSALAVTWHRPKRSTTSPAVYRIAWRKADSASSEQAEMAYANETAFLPGNAERFVISNLEPYRKYVVNVSGLITRNSVQTDVFSAHGQGETHPEPCPEPKDLSVERISRKESSSSVLVSWSPPDGRLDPPVGGYLIVICPLVDGKGPRVKPDCRTAKTSANETRSVFDEVGFAGYVVEVRAFVEHDCDTIEGDVAVSFLNDSDPPPSPRVDGLKVVLLNWDAVNVSWSEATLSAGRRVTYKLILFLTEHVGAFFERNLNGTQTTLVGLHPATNYTVYVTACILGKGECGDNATAVFRTPPQDTNTLSSFEAGAINSTALLVSWQRVDPLGAPPSGYRITWWNLSNDTERRAFVGKSTVPGEATNYTITALTPFETYTVEIAEIKKGQGSKARETVVGRTNATTDPAPYPSPWRVSVNAIRLNSTTSRAVVSWNPPNGTFDPPIQGFKVRVCRFASKTDVDESSCKTLTTASTESTAAFEELDNFADYSVEVRAYVEHDGRIFQGRRGRRIFRTEAPPIGAVESLGVKALTATSADVVWKEPAGLDRFTVFYNVSLFTRFAEKVLNRWANGTGIVLSSLEPWTNYTVGVSSCLIGTTRIQCGDFSYAEFSTPPSAPSVPRDLEVITTDDGKRTLVWQAPQFPNGPLTGYEVTVRCSLSTVNANVSITNIGSAVRSFAVNNAEPGASCLLSVRAYNVYKDDDDWLYSPNARVKYIQPGQQGIATPEPN